MLASYVFLPICIHYKWCLNKLNLQSHHCFPIDTYLELRWILWTAISVPHLNGCVWIVDFFFNFWPGTCSSFSHLPYYFFPCLHKNVTTNPRSEHNLKHPSLKSNAKTDCEKISKNPTSVEIIYSIFNKDQSSNFLWPISWCNFLIGWCDWFVAQNHSLFLDVVPFVLEQVQEGNQSDLCCEHYSPHPYTSWCPFFVGL